MSEVKRDAYEESEHPREHGKWISKGGGEENYKSPHEAPDHESGAPLWKLNANAIYPDDVYGPDGFRYYGSEGRDNGLDQQAFYKAVGMQNKPNGFIKVYRAVPRNVKSAINKGDWVTLTRGYAKEHGDANLNGKYKIVANTVRPRDLFTSGDSLHEWGYDPQPMVPYTQYKSKEWLEQYHIKFGKDAWQEELHPREHGRFTFGRGDRVEVTAKGEHQGKVGIVTSAVRGNEGDRHFVKFDNPAAGKIGAMFKPHELKLETAKEQQTEHPDIHAVLRARLQAMTPQQKEELRGLSAEELIRRGRSWRQSGSPPIGWTGEDAYEESEHPRGEHGRWTQTGTPQFKNWFGNSKVVDQHSHPLIVYHGTTQDIDRFYHTKTNNDADFGAAFYFSSSIDDINANYAGFGPDLSNKIEREAERIEGESDKSHNEALAEARKKFASNQGAVLPVYLKIEHPFVLGEAAYPGRDTLKESYLDLDMNYDEEANEYGEPTGKLVDFTNQLRLAASRQADADADDLISKIFERGSGMSASELDHLVRSDENLSYATDENGDLVSSEVYREALEGAGFDGIIDRKVYSKFGHGKKIGKPMSGIYEDTHHYIAFEPTQVKSAIGNRGIFDPSKPSIIDAGYTEELHPREHGRWVEKGGTTLPLGRTKPSESVYISHNRDGHIVERYEVLVNPIRRDVMALLRESKGRSLRVLRDEHNNVYAWDSWYGDHGDVMSHFDLGMTNNDEWLLHNGRLVVSSHGEYGDRGRMAIRQWLGDAAPRNIDPTRTTLLRRGFRAKAELNLRQLRATLRKAVIEFNTLGLAGSDVAHFASPTDRLRQFTNWFEVAAFANLDAKWWVYPYIDKAITSGLHRARREVNIHELTPPTFPSDTFAALHELAKAEIKGIVGALVQQVTRHAHTAVARKMRASTAYRLMTKSIDGPIRNRLWAFTDTMTNKAHNVAKIEVYRGKGITHVGLIPESHPRRIKRDHITVYDQDEEDEVDILTAFGPTELGNDVCEECQDIADDGPYTLDEAQDLLPVHPHCRCTYTPREDLRYTGEYGWRTPAQLEAQEEQEDVATVDADVDYIKGEKGQFAGSRPHAGAEALTASKLDPQVVEVDGDKWNQETARRLESEYQAVKPDIEGDVDALVKGEAEIEPSEEEVEEAYVPDEWDAMSGVDQDSTKDKWMENTWSDFYDSEVNNWHENGDALDDAKQSLVYSFNEKTFGLESKTSKLDWFTEAIDEVREQREKDGQSVIPYTDKQLYQAITIESVSSWEGKKDDMGFDPDFLNEPSNRPPPEQLTFPNLEEPDYSNELTKDMRDQLKEAVMEAFTDKAEHDEGNMDAPEWLSESAKESQDTLWEEQSDKEKFQYAKDNGVIEESEKPEPILLPVNFDPLELKHYATDYKRTGVLGRALSIDRAVHYLIKRELFPDTYFGRQLAQKVAQEMEAKVWSHWKSSSYSSIGVALQGATAAELGGRLGTHKGIGMLYAISEANNEFGHHFVDMNKGFDALKAYVRGKWEATQYLLDKANAQRITTFRSIHLDRVEGEPTREINKYHLLPRIAINRNGAASWTVDKNVANDWGVTTGRVVLRADVPRTAIIGVPAYGQNVYHEHEIVVAGTAWAGWDAWDHTAPDLSEVPCCQHGGEEHGAAAPSAPMPAEEVKLPPESQAESATQPPEVTTPAANPLTTGFNKLAKLESKPADDDPVKAGLLQQEYAALLHHYGNLGLAWTLAKAKPEKK